jgi:hypothetical protein
MQAGDKKPLSKVYVKVFAEVGDAGGSATVKEVQPPKR